MTTRNDSQRSRARAHGLFTTLALVFIPPTALAQAEDDTASCRSPGQVEIAIEGVVQPRCEMIFGGSAERRRNQRWRERRLYGVDSGGATIDVTHNDPSMDKTEVQSLPGMAIVETFSAELIERDCVDVDADDDDLDSLDAVDEIDGEEDVEDEEELLPELLERTTQEHVAVVSLGEAWSQVCPGGTALLRVDDAIGASGRVVWIGERGVLTYLGGGLTWVPRTGFEAPAFRNTWRSDFSVVMGGQTVGKKPPVRKKKPRRVKRRPRRRR